MEAEKCTPTSSTAATKSALTINDLDDDSLGIIFNKLTSYRDRVYIESVCKRWRDVSRANWCSYTKHLVIGKDTDNYPTLFDNFPEKSKNILEKSLQRLGPYLEEISFIDDYYNLEGGTIKRIVESCPNLKHLDIVSVLGLAAKDWFAYSHLEALSVYDNGDELGELFRKNKRLRQIRITHPRCKLSAFDHLDPGQLEILHIRKATFGLTAELIAKLAESLVELCYVPIMDISHYNLHLLSKLKNLRTLILKITCLKRL